MVSTRCAYGRVEVCETLHWGMLHANVGELSVGVRPALRVWRSRGEGGGCVCVFVLFFMYGVPSVALAVAQTGQEGGVGSDSDMF